MNPEIRQEDINLFTYGKDRINKELTKELIDKIGKLKAKIESKQSFMDKTEITWEDITPKLKVIFSPILILFFPFTLHPLRN